MDFSDDAVDAWIAMEKTHPSLASEQAFLAAQVLPFPRCLPMQHTYRKESFFVRPCYSQYYEYIVGAQANPEVGVVTITGTPGIGKSMFMAYYFLRFRLENPTKTILMQSYDRFSRLMEVTVWKDGDVCAYVSDPSAAAVDVVVKYRHEAAVCLVDGPPPNTNRYKFYLCFTSPNEVWFKTISKNPDAVKVFMPVWDVEELRTAARVLGLDALLEPLDQAGALELALVGGDNMDVLEARVKTFGGVARPCLIASRQYWKASLMELQKAIESVKTYACLDGNSPPTPPSHDACHRLFHYFLFDPAVYDEVYINVASPYVRKLALAHILQLQRQQQIMVENLLLVNSITMGVAGFVVEKRVHSILLEGATFSARLLRSNLDVSGGLVMRPFIVKRTDLASGVPTNFDLATLPDGPYYIPISQNMTAIDSFYYQDHPTLVLDSADGLRQPRVILFQVTVSKVHPIKSEGVVDVLSRLKLWGTSLAETVAFVFVVPKTHADMFKKQRMLAVPSLSAATGLGDIKGIGPTIVADLAPLLIRTVAELDTVVVDASSMSAKQLKNYNRAKAVVARHREREVTAGGGVLPDLEVIPQYVWGV